MVDAALAAVVPEDYWEKLSSDLSRHLREGQPLLALTTTIHTLGETQANHWAAKASNPDELPNNIIHDS